MRIVLAIVMALALACPAFAAEGDDNGSEGSGAFWDSMPKPVKEDKADKPVKDEKAPALTFDDVFGPAEAKGGDDGGSDE